MVSRKKDNRLLVIFIVSILILMASVLFSPAKSDNAFDQESAYAYLEQQLAFGPRIPLSEGHTAFKDWAVSEFQNSGWQVKLQTGTYRGKQITNIIATNEGWDEISKKSPWLLLGAHYDTRTFATEEQSEENRQKPVPGANDGASGVAVLLELARSLPRNLDKKVWLVLFDAEDQGDIPGWDAWCIGSSMMAQSFEKETDRPDAVVIVDMVGDKDLQLPIERNSDSQLAKEIWTLAENEGFGDIFIKQPKYAIYDDHVPFLQIGIPAVDLIDFDYPAWHTLEDDIQNVSADSLAVVGSVLYAWINN
jgi:glutaminyl-peptide cyclotransferase